MNSLKHCWISSEIKHCVLHRQINLRVNISEICHQHPQCHHFQDTWFNTLDKIDFVYIHNPIFIILASILVFFFFVPLYFVHSDRLKVFHTTVPSRCYTSLGWNVNVANRKDSGSRIVSNIPVSSVLKKLPIPQGRYFLVEMATNHQV